MSTEPDYRSPGVRAAERIAAAHAARPRVDANGVPIDPPTVYQYDVRGRLIAATPAPEPQPDADTTDAEAEEPPRPRMAPDPAQGARGDAPTDDQPLSYDRVRAAAADAALGRTGPRQYHHGPDGRIVRID